MHFIHNLYPTTYLHLQLTLRLPRTPPKIQRILGLNPILDTKLKPLLPLRLNPIFMRHPPLILILPQLQQMHLIRPIHDPHRPPIRIHRRQRRILAHARAAIRLDRAVDDIEVHLRDQHFHLCDFLERALRVRRVDGDGRVEHRQPCGVDLDARARHPVQHDAVLVQHLAEGLLLGIIDAREEPFQSFFGRADGPHRVVDAAWPETPLDDLEAVALAENEVGGGHPHVGEGDVAVAVGRVVVAEDAEHAVDGDAGDVVRDEDDGLLLVFGGVVRVGLA